jgi:hypothetical protein
MPSTISAGTTAGTAIAVAGDTTGNLAFQTNGTTTAMTIDTSQNVGIGTGSPTAKLTVVDGGGTFVSVDANGYPRFTQSSGSAQLGLFRSSTSAGGGYIGGDATNCFDARDSAFTTRLAVTQAGLLQFNSGYGSVATAYGCRAWVNFNGKGTVAIRASGNVSSITDDGTGNYRANFTNAMPDVNFAVLSSAADGTTYGGYHIASSIGNDSTGSARVWVGWTNGAADLGWVYIAVFR